MERMVPVIAASSMKVTAGKSSNYASAALASNAAVALWIHFDIPPSGSVVLSSAATNAKLDAARACRQD
jgi:hypothetical protein